MFPESSSTFRDLILDVMVEVGEAIYPDQADNSPALPTDTATLEQFKRDINQAAEDLARRHEWDWLEPDYTLTLSTDGTGPDCIDSSAFRYALPSWVRSRSKGLINYTLDDAVGGSITVRDKTFVERMIAAYPSTSGEPVYASFDFVHFAGGTLSQRPSSKFIVWPKPADAYVVTMQLRASLPKLADVGQRPIWPQEFDRAVVMGAVLNRVRRGNSPDAPSVEQATARYEQIVDDLKKQQQQREPMSRGAITRGRLRTINPPRPSVVRTYTGATL